MASSARRESRAAPNVGGPMLETIIVILIILWLLGYFALNVGNLIHILLVIAVIVILIRVIQGRRPIYGWEARGIHFRAPDVPKSGAGRRTG
jgi:Family of unknown function (DUF5670)